MRTEVCKSSMRVPTPLLLFDHQLPCTYQLLCVGKCRRGRPRETWARTIEKERAQLGFRTWNEAETAAIDRLTWRIDGPILHEEREER